MEKQGNSEVTDGTFPLLYGDENGM